MPRQMRQEHEEEKQLLAQTIAGLKVDGQDQPKPPPVSDVRRGQATGSPTPARKASVPPTSPPKDAQAPAPPSPGATSLKEEVRGDWRRERNASNTGNTSMPRPHPQHFSSLRL